MREILFKGKRTDNGEGVEGDLVHSVYKIGDTCVGQYGNTIGIHQVDTKSVSEFTGLYDKNGKKIFEGDIVKCKHEWQNQGRTMDTDEVAFLEQKIRGAYGKYIDKSLGEIFRWRFHYFRNYAVEYYALSGGLRVRNGSCFHSLTQTYITNRDLEVIGNIHDNPELMKGGAE